MGKYLGKCKGVAGEIAAVSVRTRARAALVMAAAATNSAASSSPAKKIRKSAAATTPYNTHNLRGHRRVVVTSEENSASSSPSCIPETTSSSDVVVVVEAAANCSSGVVSSDFPASCCSRNSASNSDEIVMDRFEITTDQEQVESAQTSSMHLHCRSEARRSESKLGAAEADKLDSPPRIPNAKSTVQIKMPSDSEIEDFFATAEKDLQKRFSDKYNFDVVVDVPLEGRYEWVPIKP